MNTTTTQTTPGRSKWQYVFNRRNVVVAAVLITTFVGYRIWTSVAAGDNLDQYQIASVQRGDVEDLVTATGTLQPRDYVDVGAQVSGQLKKIHVEVGSLVETGMLLAEIDPTVFRANVEARQASLRNQRATLMDKESQLALAQLQYTRQKNLMAGDATTTESVQAAEAAVRSAKAQLLALQAQIEQTESTLKADEANLNYAQIYAPMSGVVVSISAKQGQTLNANQQAPVILRIADLSTMTVQTQVSEADVSRLSPDMEVYFTTLGSRKKRWYGKLRKVEPTPTVTNNVVLYNALFDVPNNQRSLLPQMTAQVFFVAATAKDALFIPVAALNVRNPNEDPKKRNGGKPDGQKKKDASNTASAADTEPVQKPETSKVAAEATAKAPVAADTPSREDRRPRSDNMTDEDKQARRSRFESMSEEERQAYRANPRNREDSASAQRPGDMTDAERQDSHNTRRTGEENNSPPSPAGSPRKALPHKSQSGDTAKEKSPTRNAAAQVWAGVATQVRRDGGEATIKVVNAKGRIEERKVKLGISNRVHVQVISGLQEGEQVIAGIKPPPSANKAQGNAGQQQGNALQSPTQGAQGGPGMGGQRR